MPTTRRGLWAAASAMLRIMGGKILAKVDPIFVKSNQHTMRVSDAWIMMESQPDWVHDGIHDARPAQGLLMLLDGDVDFDSLGAVVS